MYKLKLEPIYDYTIPRGTQGWSLAMRDHVCYRLLTDEQHAWLFRNTKGRFSLDGHYIFFEREDDLMAFKLAWM